MKTATKFKFIVFTFCLVTTITTVAQQSENNLTNDTLQVKTLDSVIVNAKTALPNPYYLPDVKGLNLFAGKRTNTITLSIQNSGSELNLGRTVLAQIPGLTMWEMDGAGTQLNIGSRGTDPHRSIEMNMQQNGYSTNSDLFGYPENHYSVPMQAIEEIQLVRGSAALQSGPQFGGMMNYKLKDGDSSKPFTWESDQTIGANGFFNSYNAVGGTKRKFNYYAFYDNRNGNGWRNNARFNYHSYYIHLGYQLTKKINIAFEYSAMNYTQQIAGGLTDAQFNAQPKQSQRSRNFFQPIINIPALRLHFLVSSRTELEIISHALLGERNSVQFINAGNIADTFNTTLHSYNPRQVDRDYYTGFTTEARLLHHYKVGKIPGVLSGGLHYFTQVTRRKQKGVGTTAADFDLSLIRPYGIDLRLQTHNYAAFIENSFRLTPGLSFTPGMRYEIINTSLDGVINNAANSIAYRGKRNFPLFGAGLQYQLNSTSQLYGNISQAYRPYLYASVTPADRLDKIDPTLKDSKGYNIDFGYRGRLKKLLRFDFNVFYLFYGNKIGLLTVQESSGNSYLLTTNIGNSVAKGIESYIEISLVKLFKQQTTSKDIRIFNSLAYNHAVYTKAIINKAGINASINGNYVENAPTWINKTGINFSYHDVSAGIQYSYTSKSFNDAFNTEFSSNGVIGAIPAYHVFDVSFSWQFLKNYHLSAGLNNFTNEKYFNRRITFYPGPGILPADGRTFFVTAGVKF